VCDVRGATFLGMMLAIVGGAIGVVAIVGAVIFFSRG
jgi:hypothetical protein